MKTPSEGRVALFVFTIAIIAMSIAVAAAEEPCRSGHAKGVADIMTGYNLAKANAAVAAVVAQPSVEYGKILHGQMTIAGRGFSKKDGRYDVNFYLNDDFLQTIKTEDGSFSYTTPRDKVHDGDRIMVRVLNYNGSGKHWERTVTALNDDDAAMPDEKLRNYADQQARSVANRVADTFGMRENWKYNFSTGFWQGYSDYKLFGEGAFGRVNYNRGLTEGKSQGGQDGYSKGERQAREKAESLVGSDVRSRFVSIVDANREPDLRVRLPEHSYSGADGTVDSSFVDNKLHEVDSAFQKELATMRWTSENFELRYNEDSDTWTIRNVFSRQGKYEFNRKWFWGDYAYGEWKNNRLGGSYDYNLWKKMDANEKDRFERRFKKTYENVIDEKFWQKRTQANPIAQARGYFYGQTIGAQEAYQEGWNKGYQTSYRSASIRGFDNIFESTYRDMFEKGASRYLSGPVVEIQDAVLTNDVGATFFQPGDTVGVSITKAVNLGRQPARLHATLQGNEIQPLAAAEEETMVLPASSSNPKALVYRTLAKIPNDAKSDTTYYTTLKVGDASTTLSFKIGWLETLQTFAGLDAGKDPTAYEKTRHYILSTLTQEWLACIGQSQNWYRLGSSKLNKLVTYYESLDSRKKENFRSMAAEIYKIQEQGGGWHHWQRKSFKKTADSLK